MCFGWYGIESNVPVSELGLLVQRVSAWEMLTGESLRWPPSVGRTGSRVGSWNRKGRSAGRSRKFLKRPLGGAFLGGRKSAFWRERKKVNRWEERSGSISAPQSVSLVDPQSEGACDG